jgi:hypothetical protein
MAQFAGRRTCRVWYVREGEIKGGAPGAVIRVTAWRPMAVLGQPTVLVVYRLLLNSSFALPQLCGGKYQGGWAIRSD